MKSGFDHGRQELRTIREDDVDVESIPASSSPLRSSFLHRDSGSTTGLSVAETTRADIFDQRQDREQQPKLVAGQDDAEPARNTDSDCSDCRIQLSFKLWLLLCILLLGVVAAVVAIASTVNPWPTSAPMRTDAPSILSDDFYPTENPTMQPSVTLTSEQEELQNFLATNVSSEVLNTSTTYYQTWKWITFEDPAEMRIGDSEWRIIQRFMAAHLYFSLGGENWTFESYLEESHECKWMGLDCDDVNHISVINLTRANLSGRLPSELSLLSSVQQLLFANNRLMGSIPETVWDMKNLTWLNFNTNAITGQLSSRLWTLPSLWLFNADGNLLSGEIPEVSDVNSPLTSFSADNNRFHGTLPAGLWNLTDLTILSLSNNNLTGELPALPHGSGRRLRVLHLGNNEFQGSLPLYSGMTNLQIADIHGNELSSQIPKAWFEMPMLSFLDLCANNFDGSIATIPSVSLMEYLYLHNNSISGTLPENLPFSMKDAWLHDNNFSGSIPSEFGLGSPYLESLRIQGNNISGSVPLGLCTYPNLTLLESDCLVKQSPYVNCSCCDFCY